MLRFTGLGIAASTLLLGALPGSAPAWNSIGHQAIAKLAYDQMEDGLKTKLFTILKSHPHYERFLAAHRPVDVSEVEWVIIRSSIWPDWVRPRGKNDPRGSDVTRYHRGEEHYVNVPYVNPKDEKWAAGKTLVDPDLANILSALKQRCNDLKTKTADAADRAIAICWIFHLVGDIHQPLHNVAYFSAKDFATGDLGGNAFGVQVDGKKIRLHTYWDNLLGDDPSFTDDSAEHEAKVFRQAVKVAESLRGLALSDAEKDKLANNRTIASWSEESYGLAKTVGYQKADGSGILEGVVVPFSGSIPDAAPEVGQDYIRAARAVAEVRAVLAGQRLSERIKMLLP